MAVVDIQDVSKRYHLGQTLVQALKGVSVHIEAGEFAAVRGPSGSGKTTLLNLMGAIDEPSSGHVHICGKDVAALSDDDRSELRNTSIGYVFQNFNLVPVLSALENVMLPLQIRAVPVKTARRLAQLRLEQVGLADCLRQRPDKLSGGQRQRVSIARALVGDPSLVLADEPTANLDSDTAVQIVDLMRELNREQNTTFIFATHDARLLHKTDRCLVLMDGRLGAPAS